MIQGNIEVNQMELSEALGLPTKAKIGRTMQKEEWINTILTEIIINPKITNQTLAEKYGVNRNSISHWRNTIRKRQKITNYEIVNKIDSILEDRLTNMEDRDLIAYRKAVFGDVTVTANNIKFNITNQVNELIKISRTEDGCKLSTTYPASDIP